VSRKKQKRRQYSDAFKREALERMKIADNIVELARELGIGRPLLYQWEAAAEGRGRKKQGKRGAVADPNSDSGPNEEGLRQEVTWLREALAKKVKEVDFFKGALQRVAERRHNSGGNGGTASTTKSGQ